MSIVSGFKAELEFSLNTINPKMLDWWKVSFKISHIHQIVIFPFKTDEKSMVHKGAGVWQKSAIHQIWIWQYLKDLVTGQTNTKTRKNCIIRVRNRWKITMLKYISVKVIFLRYFKPWRNYSVHFQKLYLKLTESLRHWTLVLKFSEHAKSAK